MYRVVIVEDDPMISQLNYQYIQKEPDFQVVNLCKTGKEALQWLKKYPADLLILDVYMPIMSGLELLHTLRAMDFPIDVIMVTAANDPETVDTLFKLGAIDYLVKARNADPALAEEANKLIGQYSTYFPQTGDAFMYGITNGDSYTVSCGGMRAVTTVRTQD